MLLYQTLVTFKIKTGYYLELLMPETMKLLGNTKNKLTKDTNGENVPHLEINEVVLVHCNYNLIEYRNSYSKPSGNLWQY